MGAFSKLGLNRGSRKNVRLLMKNCQTSFLLIKTGRILETVIDGPRLLLITNSMWHMLFQMSVWLLTFTACGKKVDP